MAFSYLALIWLRTYVLWNIGLLLPKAGYERNINLIIIIINYYYFNVGAKYSNIIIEQNFTFVNTNII